MWNTLQLIISTFPRFLFNEIKWCNCFILCFYKRYRVWNSSVWFFFLLFSVKLVVCCVFEYVDDKKELTYSSCQQFVRHKI